MIYLPGDNPIKWEIYIDTHRGHYDVWVHAPDNIILFAEFCSSTYIDDMKTIY